MKISGCILTGTVLLALTLPRVVAELPAISMTSPFLPRDGSVIGGATENSPVELRGIMNENGSPLFGLYDPVKRQGGWLKLNETGTDFPATVKSYDASNDAVTVEYQGRMLSVALKTAKIETLPLTAQVNRPLPNQPPAMGNTSAQNMRQLEAVAAEVQRRRLERQAALRRYSPTSPTPIPGMPPTYNQPMRSGAYTPPNMPRGNGIGLGAGNR